MSLAEFGTLDTLRTTRLPKLPPIEPVAPAFESLREGLDPDDEDTMRPDDLAGGARLDGGGSARITRVALEAPSITGTSLRSSLPLAHANAASHALPRPATTDGYTSNNGYRRGAAASMAMSGSQSGNCSNRLGIIVSLLRDSYLNIPKKNPTN